jgi:hypothetical protein
MLDSVGSRLTDHTFAALARRAEAAGQGWKGAPRFVYPRAMASLSTNFERAIARFDAVNRADPNLETDGGTPQPKELLYACRMTEMLERFAPDASEAVQLAARCQHIRRWEIPRTSYPRTSAGYKQWRTRLQHLHAEIAGAILREEGYGEDTIERVAALLKKEKLKRDAESQLLEDVVALVFLEHYLAAFVAQHPEHDATKLGDIVRKTARKMSPRGRAAVAGLIRLPEPLAPAVLRELAAAGAAA